MTKTLQKVGGFAIALLMATTVLVPVSNTSAQTTTNMCAGLVRDLTLGSTGSDVAVLQTFLEQKGYLTIPFGVSKGYFGTLTRAAVSRYQVANGIYPTYGYFGPLTRGRLVAACATTVPTPTPGDDDDNDDDLSGGDGDFRDFDILSNPSDESVEEGEDKAVLGFEFEADDSDLRVDRIDVEVSADGNERPWRFLETLTLYNGDDEVASIDASDEDVWDEIGSTDEYEATFSDVDAIIDEGDMAEMYIHVETRSSIDDSDLPVTWTISIPQDGVRAVNAEGRDVFEGNIEETFELEVADSSDLDTTLKASENEDQSIEVDDSTDVTEEVLLYTFTVEAQDGDINIDEVNVTLATTTGTVASLGDIVKTLYLFIDGDEVGSESGDTAVSFEDIDFDLSEDDEVTVEVFADVEGTDDGDQFVSGDGIKVTGLTIDYVDSQDDDQTQSDLETTDGGDIVFYTTGITADFVNSSAVATYGSFAGDNDRAVFTITFEVTAFGTDDIYIGGANDTDSTNNGINYTISNPGAAVITKAELTSNAEEGDNDTYVVSAGDTETFTFEVEVSDASTVDPDVAQRLTITGIKWDVDDDATPDNTYDDNLDDFETASKTI